MKFKVQTTSTLMLWCCMLITIVVFISFFTGSLSEKNDVGLVLQWTYILLIATAFIAFIFTCRNIVNSLKTYPKSIWKLLFPPLVFILLLLSSYLFGSGKILNMPQYTGNFNVYLWLKITDMWLYSIYVLLGITIISIVVSIIWSNLKK